MAVSACDPQPASPNPGAHAGRGAAHTVHLCAHTCALTDAPTLPRAHTGACRHMHAHEITLRSTAPQRSARPHTAVPRCSPKVQLPEQARAVRLAGVAGRGPSQGGLGKPWGRLPPRARVSLPFKKPARGGGGCKGCAANGSCAPRETCRREPERVTEPVPTDRRTEGQTAAEAHSLPPYQPPAQRSSRSAMRGPGGGAPASTAPGPARPGP